MQFELVSGSALGPTLHEKIVLNIKNIDRNVGLRQLEWAVNMILCNQDTIYSESYNLSSIAIWTTTGMIFRKIRLALRLLVFYFLSTGIIYWERSVP